MNVVAPLDVQHRAWLRIQDFLTLQESGAFADNRKTELIDGEVLTMNAQFVRHAYAKSLLHLAIDKALRGIGSPLVVIVEASVAMPPFDLPEPDLVVTIVPTRGGPIPVTDVTVLIEVADTTQKFDLGRKAFVYARNNVPEYWVVDLADRVLVKHSCPGVAGYEDIVWASLGEGIGSTAIAGLFVETADLMGLPDRE